MGTKTHYRLAVSGFFFIQGLVYSSWAGRAPDIKAALGLDNGTYSLALLALPAGQLSAMILSGYLVHRFGSRLMLAFAAILYPLALINLSFAHGFWQFVMFGFLFGVCGNLSNISVNTQGVGVERLYHTSIMSGFHGVWSIASCCGALLSMFMIDLKITTTNHFIIVLAIAAAITFTLYRSTLPRDRKPPVEKDAPPKKKGMVFNNKYILILGFIGCSSMLCEGAMFNWSGIYFQSIVQPGERLILMGFIAFTFAMTLGRFIAGSFVNRFGVVTVIRTCGLIIMSGLLLAALFPTMIPATIGFALVGFGTSAVVPLCYSMAGKAVSIPPSIAIASVSSISFLGFLIGPPIIGQISEILDLRFSLVFVALIGLMISLLSSRVRGK